MSDDCIVINLMDRDSLKESLESPKGQELISRIIQMGSNGPKSSLLTPGESKESKASVIDIADHKPHACGPCVCVRCGHKWYGVMPLPILVDKGYECSQCHTHNGFLEYPIGGREGDLNYVCACGSAYFVVQRRGILCAICGLTHLNVLEKFDDA